jgi:hypothetical protein
MGQFAIEGALDEGLRELLEQAIIAQQASGF